jgi:hypothetical protein
MMNLIFQKALSISPLRVGCCPIRQSSRQLASSCKTSVDLDCKGLLSGISDIASAHYYSDKLVIKNTYHLLQDSQYIFDICSKNAGGDTARLNEDLMRMAAKAGSYIKSDVLWNRDELESCLYNIVTSKGRFVCLLAGKSTGKSLVLKKLQEGSPDKVFVVNLRLNPNILTGLVKTLRDRQQWDMQEKAKEILVRVVTSFAMRSNPLASNMIKPDEVQRFLDIAYARPDSEALPALINDLVKGLGEVTLVIDEANIAFTILSTTPYSEIKAVKEALGLFTTLTKEQKKVSDQSNHIYTCFT